jgi:hypothetical protein
MAGRAVHKVGTRVSTAAAGRRSAAAGTSSPASALEKLAGRIPKGATLRRQYVSCGKCPRRHGPYWYAAWWAAGRTRTAYIGSDERLGEFMRMRGAAAGDQVDAREPDEWNELAERRAQKGLDEILRRFESASERIRRYGLSPIYPVEDAELVQLVAAGFIKRVSRYGKGAGAFKMTAAGLQRFRHLQKPPPRRAPSRPAGAGSRLRP